MPRRPKGSLPSLQHHKTSGRARVTINGRDHWLGKWGSQEARSAYDRLIAEYLASGRITPASQQPPEPAAPVVEASVQPRSPGVIVGQSGMEPTPFPTLSSEPTVAEVMVRYLEHCDTYYRTPAGERTSTYGNALQAARALRPFDDTLAAKFGPRSLGMIRDSEAARGRPRVGCNAIVKSIRRVFQWAESQELVPRGTHNSLKTVEPLRKGRTIAPELPPIKPVDDAVVEATLPFLPEIVADMVRFQRLTGTRPGEVCGLRPMDIDRSEPLWKWRPPEHKTSWREKDRVIIIGPRAQQILRPYLLRDAAAHCFSPAEAERRRSQLRRLARKSPLTPSQRARKAKKNGRRRPRHHYDSASYRHAIARAVAALNKDRLKQDPKAEPVEDWSPNQLRHAAATEIREKFGLEAAQVVLGHSSADITQVYAERNQKLAAEVIRQIG
jgi:integrase